MISSLATVVTLVFAGGTHGEGILWNLDLWKVINLLVFLLLIFYIFRNKLKIGQVFETRALTIQRELEQAKREKQEAHDRLAELNSRLGKLDQEVAEIRAEAERDAQREAERIKQLAEADAGKIQDTVRREIDGAMKSARAELRAVVAEQSVALAEAAIRREIRPEDNSRLLNGYVNELREVKK